MIIALHPDTERPVEIETAGGRIVSVRETTRDPGGLWVSPGLIDLQVNGFSGVDYAEPETPLEAIARSICDLESTGVTRFLPTVITGSAERMIGSLRNLARAKAELPEGKRIAGFHVEGPYISPEEGPRGAHPKEHVRPPSRDEFLRMEEAARGGIRLFTLAPEIPGALDLIEFLAERGVVVCLGHCAPTTEQVRDAIRAGATMSTHLGNGSHSMLPRHPNYIWDQMASDELYAGLIGDGIHLPPAFVKVAVRAKGLEKSVLVTDAAPPANCTPGRYKLAGMDVDLTPSNQVYLAGTQRLAGSALRMDRGVENLMTFAGLSLPQALRLATVNPARAARIREREGFLQPGDPDDLILFRFDPERPGISIQ